MSTITIPRRPINTYHTALQLAAAIGTVAAAMLICLICPFAFLRRTAIRCDRSASQVMLTDWNRELLAASGYSPLTAS